MTDGRPAPDQDALSKIDTTVPHSARIWNYWMGGKDNYEVDRIAGDAYREHAPTIETMARASRQYLIRAVTFVAGDLASASSSTSAPDCRRTTTPIRWPSASRPRRR